MSNAYEVSKRVFEEYFLKRNHVQTAVTPGVKEYNRGSVSNPEYAPIYMGGRYYRMASFMIFLSQLEYEAREVHKEDSLAVEVSDELSKAINAIFDETSEGGEMEGYLRDGPMDGGTPGISALTASLVFIKGLNGNLCDNVKERVEDMLDQCWDWSDRHYREHTWSFMDDHTIEYMVDHLIVDDEQSFPNARYPMNGVMWYAYAMAMDSYLNHNGQVYDQPYGRTARRFKNMGIYIQEINYDVSQFSKNLTAGKQHLTGAGRPVLIAGYTSWTGMHLGMLEYGLKANHERKFYEEVEGGFQAGARELAEGFRVLVDVHGVVPNQLSPDTTVRREEDFSSLPTHIADDGEQIVDYSRQIPVMNTGDVKGDQPFQDWWDRFIKDYYPDVDGFNTSIEHAIDSDWRAEVQGDDRDKRTHDITEPNFLRACLALAHGMMRRLTFR